ncbi:Transposon Tf2-9 polyprotein, partial [Choanephora cucurbitarum]
MSRMENNAGVPKIEENYKDNMAELIRQFTSILSENKQVRIKEPNTYDGTRDALLIDGWIRSIERYTEFHGWSTEKSCLFATTLLRDRADAWYRTLEVSNDTPTSWLEFKRLLIDFFRPDNSVRIARDKLAALRQTGNLVDYVNAFMDIKLAIPGMTDEEACDKFVRGLALKSMRAHIRQYEADTLKDAVRAALSYDSAQREEDFVRPVNGVRSKVVDDPMELDALDSRRGNFSNYHRGGGFSRTGGSARGDFGSRRFGGNSGGSNNLCYYCDKPGHMKRNLNVVEDQEVQLHDDNDNIPENKNLIDLDPYTIAPLDNELFPQKTDELKYLGELNSIATSLPLYCASFNDKTIKILIDSDQLISVHDRQVETAGGTIAQIKYKVQMKVNLNGYDDLVTAYVFPTKFDLILGRSWLKHIELKPCVNSKSVDYTKLNYLISHKQANKSIKKGADSFLLYIKPTSDQVDKNPQLQNDSYWDELVREFGTVFQDSLPGLPPDRGIEHVIDVGDARPISRPPYKMSPLELQELQKQLKELLKLGLIRPSSSPWGAPVLFVRKKPDPGSHKPGALRMCIDYRMLNKYTIRNSSSLPRIDECLEQLSGKKYFSSLDLKSGYHQIRINERDIPLTAFNTRYGQFAWNVLPMGLCNAPPVFQTMMNKVLADCIDKFALVYLDDILIFSDNWEDHKKHVRHVIELLKKEKLVANLKKCEFGKRELTFVGYRISAEGISPSPEKVKVIQEWPRMTNVQEVRQFIGFAQFYKRLIPNFATIAAPLTDLTRGNGLKKRPIVWNDDCQRSFDQLKKLLSSSPVLQVVDMDKPFRIEVDASDRGCGAVCLQPAADGSDLWKPIAFESKKFSEAERKYPAQERELLGILHALRTWRCYIDGCPKGYVVYSDHLPLQYFRTKDKPPSRLVRWISELELFSPTILYKPGKDNHIPDALSRMNYDSPDVPPAADSMEPDYLYAAWDKLSPGLRSDWPLLLLPQNREKVKSDEVKHILDREEKNFDVPFLPFSERADTVAKYHNSFGHAGYKSMLKMLVPRFWWPSLRLDLQNWLSTCPSCQVNSRRTRAHQDEMHPLKVPTAFDRWHLDFLDLPETVKGNRWLLIGVDYATNWPVARALPVASREAVADFIYEEIVMRFGVPSEIVTDRGANFTSGLVKTYLRKVGVNHKLTSAYHPRSNGKVERFNGVIKQMLRKYTNGALHRWDDFVNAALWACRIRVHSTTGFSPFYLTYGREPRLPGDVLQPYIDATVFKDPRTVADHTARELAQLGQHRAAAEFRLKAMAEKDKEKWDAAIKKVTFEPGDLVMLTHEGRFGLEPKFKGPYVVVKVFPDFGTYQLQTISGEPLKSLVHVDRMKIAKGAKPESPWYDPTVERR